MRGGASNTAARVVFAVALAVSPGLWPADAAAADTTVTTVTGDIQLAATQALIMTGTNMHTVDAAWMQLAVDQFIRPSLGGDFVGVAVQTPEEFWPFGGITDAFIDDSIVAGGTALDAALADASARNAAAGDPGAPIVVFGYSQSAVITTGLKRRLAAAAADGGSLPPLSLVVIGNPARPNGGLYARFAGRQLPGWTMSGAAPTDVGITTVDIARQYDFFADFPQDPSNTLAVANAVMGIVYAHDYRFVTVDPNDARYNPGTVVQTYGDTTYYLIPADHLPLLQPLWDAGFSPEQLGAIEPGLRTLIEQGYDRNISYGQPTTVLPGPVPAAVLAPDPSPLPSPAPAPTGVVRTADQARSGSARVGAAEAQPADSIEAAPRPAATAKRAPAPSPSARGMRTANSAERGAGQSGAASPAAER